MNKQEKFALPNKFASMAKNGNSEEFPMGFTTSQEIEAAVEVVELGSQLISCTFNHRQGNVKEHKTVILETFSDEQFRLFDRLKPKINSYNGTSLEFQERFFKPA